MSKNHDTAADTRAADAQIDLEARDREENLGEFAGETGEWRAPHLETKGTGGRVQYFRGLLSSKNELVALSATADQGETVILLKISDRDDDQSLVLFTPGALVALRDHANFLIDKLGLTGTAPVSENYEDLAIEPSGELKKILDRLGALAESGALPGDARKLAAKLQGARSLQELSAILRSPETQATLAGVENQAKAGLKQFGSGSIEDLLRSILSGGGDVKTGHETSMEELKAAARGHGNKVLGGLHLIGKVHKQTGERSYDLLGDFDGDSELGERIKKIVTKHTGSLRGLHEKIKHAVAEHTGADPDDMGSNLPDDADIPAIFR
jgi:hypothetical protein